MSLVLAVIPARYASTRFPGKALASLGDRSLIQEVWTRASRAKRIDRLVIATDDQRIVDAAAAVGAEARWTAKDHASGTDRVAEVARSLDEPYDVVVNIQGDEALVTPTSLDRLIAAFDRPAGAPIATLAEPIDRVEDLFDPNVVKVVTAGDGTALFFSRSAIPYYRGDSRELEADFRDALAARPGGLTGYLKHQGIYAYTRRALEDLTRLAPSALELDEGLEQLRALQAGFAVRIVESDFRSLSVDTPADLDRVVRILTEAR